MTICVYVVIISHVIQLAQAKHNDSHSYGAKLFACLWNFFWVCI